MENKLINIISDVIEILQNDIFIDGTFEDQIKILEKFIEKILTSFRFEKGLILLKEFDSYTQYYNGFIFQNNRTQFLEFIKLKKDLGKLGKYKFKYPYEIKINSKEEFSLINRYEKAINENTLIIPFFLKDELLGILEFSAENINLSLKEKDVFKLIISQFNQSLNNNYLYLNSRRRLVTLEAVSKIKDAISSILDLSLLFPLLVDLAIKEINAEVGTIILFNERFEIKDTISIGIDEKILKQIKHKDENIFLIEYLLKKNSLVCLSQLSLLRDFDIPLRFKSKFHSLISAPIIIKGKIIGLFILLNKHENGILSEFGEHDVVFLNAIIGQSAVSIENAKLVNEILEIKTLNENILQSIKTGLITTDNDGFITFFNKGAEIITEFSFKKVKNKNFIDFFNLKKEKEKILKNENFDFEIKFETKKSKIINLHLTITPLLNAEKEKEGKVIYFEDITEALLMQRQIQRSEKLAALGEFSAGVAHEIKNPLTSILGFTQMLPYRISDKSFIENYITIITEEVTRLNTTVERLLDFAKPKDSGFEYINVHSIIDNVIELMKIEAKRNNTTIEKNFNAENDVIKGEKDSLLQVFLNIILNSVQAINNFNKEKTGFIKIKTKNFTKEGIKYIFIKIEDNGPGIKISKIDEIFNPFFSTKEQGTGLGLSISYRIIEQHNGKIEVRNNEIEGVSFSIYLPLIY